MIELTNKEAAALAETIELNIFDIIRDDTDIDNIEWLCSMVSVYNKCKDGDDGQEMQDV